MKRRWRDVPVAVAMLAPAAVILGIFVLYPLGRAVWMGHQRCNISATTCTTTGWNQYVDVFRSTEFQHALGVTIKFVLLTVPVGLALGIGLAVLADKAIRGIGFFRTVFSSTVASSVAVSSLMWLFLLQPSIGVLSNIGWIGRLFPVVKSPGLLNDQGTALSAVAVSSIWANLGFSFIIVTAGMQSIPRELYESAFVDGAGGLRRFTNVTLPMLSPTLLFLSVVLVSRAFQAYGEIDLLTSGGPTRSSSTTTVTYFIYGSSSVIRRQPGLQATSAVLLFLVLLVLSLVQFRGFERRVHYGGGG
jgi:ABC-type sugar transport system permease subunit